MTGISRTSVNSIAYLLKNFPCVAVLGARQTGKTTLLGQVWPNVPRFDLERQADYQRIASDLDFFFSHQRTPIVIDEAQTMPELFSALRVAIDARRSEAGRFLLSGSSSPLLLEQISESLAGRIAILELGGFSLEETWQRHPSRIYDILANGRTEDLAHLKPQYSLDELLDSCLAGSYPEPVLRRSDRQYVDLWMENYANTYVRRDVRSLFPNIASQTYELFIRMLAQASGQILNISELARSLDVKQPTAKNYLRIAEGTFIWRMLPSYHENVSKRVSKLPKGHFRDTGLLCYMLHIDSRDKLLAYPSFGRIWEAFITEEILKGFANQLIKVVPHYYRTQHGAEIDLVLSHKGELIPIEIKSGLKVEKRQLRALEDFIAERNCRFGLVINNAETVEQLSPKVYQVPAACL